MKYEKLGPKEQGEEEQEEAVRQNPNAKVQFADTPLRCTCPYCNRIVVTQVSFSHNIYSILLFFVLFLLLSFLTLCIYPLVCGPFKDSMHTCPRCLMVINKNRRVHLPTISKEIITFQCGQCAVVLSKAYVLGFLTILTIILGASGTRWYLRTYGLPDLQEGPPFDADWDEFYRDCGSKLSLGNPFHRTHLFEEKYAGKTVTWTGRLNKAEEGFFKRNFAFVNMDPHQSFRPEIADLALLYNVITLSDKIADLEVGDEFTFKATLVALGSRSSPHLGSLWDLNKTRSNAELPSLFGTDERYPLLNKPPIAHLPDLAKKLKDARNDFVKNRLEGDREGQAFYMADEVFGGALHRKSSQTRISSDTPKDT